MINVVDRIRGNREPGQSAPTARASPAAWFRISASRPIFGTYVDYPPLESLRCVDVGAALAG